MSKLYSMGLAAMLDWTFDMGGGSPVWRVAEFGDDPKPPVRIVDQFVLASTRGQQHKFKT
jgi:hypothetical protein